MAVQQSAGSARLFTSFLGRYAPSLSKSTLPFGSHSFSTSEEGTEALLFTVTISNIQLLNCGTNEALITIQQNRTQIPHYVWKYGFMIPTYCEPGSDIIF